MSICHCLALGCCRFLYAALRTINRYHLPASIVSAEAACAMWEDFMFAFRTSIDRDRRELKVNSPSFPLPARAFLGRCSHTVFFLNSFIIKKQYQYYRTVEPF